VLDQLVAIFGPEAANPVEVVIYDWRDEEYTSPPGVEELQAYQTFGHPRFAVPQFGGRMHWASTETAISYAGHIEGALAAADRAATAVMRVLSEKR